MKQLTEAQKLKRNAYFKSYYEANKEKLRANSLALYHKNMQSEEFRKKRAKYFREYYHVAKRQKVMSTLDS